MATLALTLYTNPSALSERIFTLIHISEDQVDKEKSRVFRQLYTPPEEELFPKKLHRDADLNPEKQSFDKFIFPGVMQEDNDQIRAGTGSVGKHPSLVTESAGNLSEWSKAQEPTQTTSNGIKTQCLLLRVTTCARP